MKRIWWLILIPFLVVSVAAQQVHQFHRLNTEQGLTSGQYNFYIHQDAHGYVWISSTAGLNRFDGKQVRTYHREKGNPRSLYTELSAQSRFAESGNGDLFFTTAVGFTRYNRKTDDFDHFWIATEEGDTIRNTYLWCYLSPDDEDLFVSGGRKIYRVDPANPVKSALVDDSVAFLKDRMLSLGEGRFLLIHFRQEYTDVRAGIYTAGAGLLEEKVLKSPAGQIINDVQILSKDSIIVATDQGVWGCQISSGDWWIYPNTERLKVLEAELLGKTMYLATRAGMLWKYHVPTGNLNVLLSNSGNKIDTFQTDIERLYIAPDSTLWIGTVGSGVHYTSLRKPAFNILRLHREGSSADVKGLEVDSAGNYFILYPGYVGVLGSKDTNYYDLPVNGTGYGEPNGISLAPDGRIWVSTYKDLYYLDPGDTSFNTYELFTGEGQRHTHGFFAPIHLPNGKLLFPVNGGHSYTIEDEDTIARPWLTSVGRMRTIVFDGVGHGVATSFEDSLHLVSGGSETPRLDSSITGLGLVNGVAYDDKNECFWIGSYSGLQQIQYKNGWQVKEIPEGNNFRSAIFSLVLGRDGLVWFTTPRGISCYDPNNQMFRQYGLSDGAQGRDFNLGVALAMHDGSIWFGGPQGISSWAQPSFMGKETGRLSVTSIRANGNTTAYLSYSHTVGPVEEIRKLTFPYRIRDLEIGVSTFDYKEPAMSEIYYILEGGDLSGLAKRVRASGVIDLFGLSPGSYTLRLYGEDSYGRSLAMNEPLTITILPPWYRTWWAYTLYFLIALGIISGYFWQILNREREKSARAQAEALAAETETSVLRLQMNPHFIFNSLNAVNAYIIKGDKLKAHEYLVRFADLIREILNRSARPLTRLDLAIELLEDYLEAERMRVGEKLTYAIEVDEEMDTFTTYLPTMILQPFVENAIWHGIGGLLEGGHITLRFMPENGERMLRAEVEDNGRGRSATAKSAQRHKSMATDITRRRLEILNRSIALSSPATAPASAPENARYEIIDLKHPDGSAAGTRVVLYLPREYPPEDARSSD